MLFIVGASGKLGFATLSSVLEHKLISADQVTCTTSSASGAEKLQATGVSVAHANWDDSQSHWERTLAGCTKLFLISSSRIAKDFHDAPDGKGREADHLRVLLAAQAAGVQHVYYTSLAFANPSQSRVMKAHERTEAWLQQQSGAMKWTVLREGLYNESWPLYVGHYDIATGDDRSTVRVAGDCKINWTSIADLGLATALILAAPAGEWEDRTCYLAQSQAYSLKEIAAMVSKIKGKEVELQIVERRQHEQFYVNERGMDAAFIEWWSKTYDALRDGECEIHDPTLDRLLEKRGVTPKSMEDTLREMLK